MTTPDSHGHLTLSGYDLEELATDARTCYENYRRGHLFIISEALKGGELLTVARTKVLHGDWQPWLSLTGIPRQTAHNWMTLYALGLSAEQIQDQGGIRAVLDANRKSRRPVAAKTTSIEADLQDALQALAASGEAVARVKRDYYDSLNAYHRAQRSARRAYKAAHQDLQEAQQALADGKPDAEAALAKAQATLDLIWNSNLSF